MSRPVRSSRPRTSYALLAAAAVAVVVPTFALVGLVATAADAAPARAESAAAPTPYADQVAIGTALKVRGPAVLSAARTAALSQRAPAAPVTAAPAPAEAVALSARVDVASPVPPAAPDGSTSNVLAVVILGVVVLALGLLVPGRRARGRPPPAPSLTVTDRISSPTGPEGPDRVMSAGPTGPA